ncbi:MAG: flagellin [Alphaproteobacteria bacterium]|jgi:flagellin|nr:flagellin [Alphaproteobacteria bacterium]
MPVISTNTAANTALIYLNKNTRAMDSSLAKLSSGSRIVRASDDSAGLAVANSLKSDITTLKQGAVNAIQARSVLQTADGALARVGDILQRMKSLTAQAVSGSVDATSRGFIDQEYDGLKAEAIAIGTNTTFNGTALLTGNYNATNNVATFQVGILATNTIVADLTTVVVTAAVMTSLAANTDTAANAIAASPLVEADINRVSAHRATVGSLLSRFEYRGDMIDSSIENITAAASAIMDVDLAAEQTNLVSSQVLTEASIASLAQANQMKTSLLSLVRQ